MITIKTEKEIEIMRQGGRLLAEVMRSVKNEVREGVTTKELDKFAETLILEKGAKPAFKGYEGYPATLCTSVNQVIVHGLPSGYRLKNGDILSLDLGLIWEGFFSDMAITIPIGEIDFSVLRLIKVTKKSLKLAIKKMRPGNTFGDVGNTIQRYVESQGFNIIRDLCGHGIGRALHEDPQVLNYGKRHKGSKIMKGMVICIEPMVSLGGYQIKKSIDGFGFETRDNSLVAHFEHTVAVAGEKEGEILTSLE